MNQPPTARRLLCGKLQVRIFRFYIRLFYSYYFALCVLSSQGTVVLWLIEQVKMLVYLFYSSSELFVLICLIGFPKTVALFSNMQHIGIGLINTIEMKCWYHYTCRMFLCIHAWQRRLQDSNYLVQLGERSSTSLDVLLLGKRFFTWMLGIGTGRMIKPDVRDQ